MGNKPTVDQLTFKIIPEDATREAMLTIRPDRCLLQTIAFQRRSTEG